MKTLTERRAEFVYNGARLAAEAAGAPIIPALWRVREDSFKAQFLEVIERQCGEKRSKSPEELHGTGCNPTSPWVGFTVPNTIPRRRSTPTSCPTQTWGNWSGTRMRSSWRSVRSPVSGYTIFQNDCFERGDGPRDALALAKAGRNSSSVGSNPARPITFWNYWREPWNEKRSLNI